MYRLGGPPEGGLRLWGDSPETLRNWLRRGEEETAGPFFEFRMAIKQAEAAACIKALGTIRSAMEESWQAAAWFLEATSVQKNGGVCERHEHTGRDGGPIRTQLRLGDLPPHERRARLNAIARRLGVDGLPQDDGAGPAGGPPRRIAGPSDAAGTGGSEPV